LSSLGYWRIKNVFQALFTVFMPFHGPTNGILQPFAAHTLWKNRLSLCPPPVTGRVCEKCGLTRVSKEHHHGWMTGVLRATAIPFTLVLILAGGLGWAAHRHCPEAVRLVDAIRCPSR
jgi:hypothetical protein